MSGRSSKRAAPAPSQTSDDSACRDGHTAKRFRVDGGSYVHIGDVYESRNTRHQDEKDTKYETLLHALNFDRIDSRYLSTETALPKTCTWLFNHEYFRTWYENPVVHNDGTESFNRFLWIKGKPGCGKSTIMKTALDWTEREVAKEGRDWIILRYFFNARASASLEKSCLGLYRSLVYQMLKKIPKLRPLFREHFSEKQPHADDPWNQSELQGFLSKAISSGEEMSLCIFIDALDEGEDETDIVILAESLVRLAELSLSSESKCSLRVCLSSRHYPHIGIPHALELFVEHQLEHDRDIEYYVAKMLRGTDDQIKEEVKIDLCRRSQGVFLWVFLVVRILNDIDGKGGLTKDMQIELKDLPDDLDKLFREIIVKNERVTDTSIILLQCLLFSMRPLKPIELYFAVNSQHLADPNGNPPASVPRKPSAEFLRRFILHQSRGLAELVSPRSPVVQFIHETVREFLGSDRGLPALRSDLSSNLNGFSHNLLKDTCALYLSKTSIPDDLKQFVDHNYAEKEAKVREILNARFPFLVYATTYLLSHADQAQKYRVRQKKFLRSQMGTGSTVSKRYRVWWNLLERHQVRKLPSDVTMSYVLASHGHAKLLSKLIHSARSHVEVVCGRYACPLGAACVHGDEETVRVLLEANVNPNSPCGEHARPIVAAVAHEKWTLIPLLLLHGSSLTSEEFEEALYQMTKLGHEKKVSAILEADPAPEDGSSKTLSLCLAAQKGKAAVIERLLECKDIYLDCGSSRSKFNSETIYFGTPLIEASGSGHIDAVKVLLDSRATVDHRRGSIFGEMCTALLAATYFNCEDVVDVLIGTGASVDLGYGTEGTHPLTLAAERGYTGIARQLIDAGADVNFRTIRGKTPLVVASQFGHEAIVHMLLDAKARIEPRDAECCSPLVHSASNGHNIIVQMLLKHKAAPNVRCCDVGLPLLAAVTHNHEDVVTELIKAGADIELQDPKVGTALMVASAGGYKNIVERLLKKGAEVDTKSVKSGRTALALAAAKDYTDIVRLLLGRNADANIQDVDQNTPLMQAARHGGDDTMQLFLEFKCLINHQNKDGDTALMWAARNRNSVVVWRLLEAGGLVNHCNESDGTALMEAAQYDRSDSIQLLLDAGGLVDHQDFVGDTALILAARLNHEKSVRQLLKYSPNLEVKNGERHTALLEACIWRNAEVANMLLIAKANVDSQTFEALLTPGKIDGLRYNHSSRPGRRGKGPRPRTKEEVIKDELSILRALLDRNAIVPGDEAFDILIASAVDNAPSHIVAALLSYKDECTDRENGQQRSPRLNGPSEET